VKSIYLAGRHPTLSRAQFVPRWRQHGELAMSLGAWQFAGRYTHGDVIRLSSDPGVRLDSDDFFGVGMVWFPGGEEGLRGLVEAPDFPRLYDDEPEAFGGHVDDLTLLTQETILWETGTVGARLVWFLTLPDGQDRDEFWSTCRERLCPDGAAPARYSENRSVWQDADGSVVGDRLPHHSAPSSLSRHDGVVELGFAGAEQLQAYCADHQLSRSTLPGDQQGIVLAVNEVVLDAGVDSPLSADGR
jgi:hypothetical protein